GVEMGVQLLNIGLAISAGIRRDALFSFDECQVGRRVAGVEVDLAAFQGGLDDLAVTELVLVVDGVALVFESVAVDVGQDNALREVERRDRDGRLRAGRFTCGYARGRDQRQGDHAGPQDVDSLQTHLPRTSLGN